MRMIAATLPPPSGFHVPGVLLNLVLEKNNVLVTKGAIPHPTAFLTGIPIQSQNAQTFMKFSTYLEKMKQPFVVKPMGPGPPNFHGGPPPPGICPPLPKRPTRWEPFLEKNSPTPGARKKI